MSPMKPAAINVAGQPHHRTLLKVKSRHADGTPNEVAVLSEEEAVKDTKVGDLIVAYLPRKETSEGQT
jgi:hypothetical protein